MLNKKALSATAAAKPITYVGGTTAAITASTATTTNVSLTSLTGGIASQPSADDIVIVYYGTGSSTNRVLSVTTSGYTELLTLNQSDTVNTNLYVGYKVMTSTPDTQVTVSATLNADDAGAVAIHVWRNVDTVFPFDVAIKDNKGGNSVLCDPGQVTPTTPGTVILAGGAGGHEAGASQTFSSSELSNFVTVGSPNDTYDATIGLGSYAWTSGGFNPAAFTFSAGDSGRYSWCAATIALRPKYTGNIPTFIASATKQSTSSANNVLVIDKPTGTGEGDLMIAVMAFAKGNTDWTGDTGWTEIVADATRPSLRIAYKVAGASEGSSYSFTATSSNNNEITGCILTYRYAAYDTVGLIGNTNIDPQQAPSITVSKPFSILLAAGARDAASITISTPAGMTARVIDNDATQPSYIVCEQLVDNGSSGNKNMTMGSTSETAAVLLSIKPA